MKKQTFGKTALSLAIAFSIAGLATQAMAQNSAVTTSSSITEQTTPVNGSLVEVGTPQNSANLKGFAKDLPLIAVLKQITPNEWVVKKAKGKTLDLQKPVSWTGGKNWVETLKVVAENNNIEAVVNWDKKEVVLAEMEKITSMEVVSTPQAPVSKIATAKATKTVGIFELSSDVVTEGSSGQTEVVTTKAEVSTINAQVTVTSPMEVTKPVAMKVEAPVVLLKSWNFESADNLKDVVESWGKKSGYKIIYNAENYPLDKEDARVFSGEFDAEDGPIKQLSVDYGPQSRVKQPLSFIFFQNRTLVIENLRYEQAGYPQYIQK